VNQLPSMRPMRTGSSRTCLLAYEPEFSGATRLPVAHRYAPALIYARHQRPRLP
jgi:hypothetical protein